MPALVNSSSAEADTLPAAGPRLGGGKLQRINPLEETGWDALLMAHPSSSFCHGSSWARVLQSTYGYTPVYFSCRGSGRIQSLLPFMEVDSWLTGRRGISLPFIDCCEPLCSDAVSFGCLFQEAMEYAKYRDWKYVECRGGGEFIGGAPASTSFYGHRLDLASGPGSLRSRMEGGVRRAIRKAEKSGLCIEFLQNLEAVRVFYELQCRTRRKHGLPPQPFRFFQSICRHILSQNQGIVVLARYRDVPVAAAMFFHWGKKALFKYGASDERFQQLRANNLVMWEAIQWYAHQGFEQLHLGRTSLSNEGLRRFKLGWGTEERRIDYFRYDRRKDGFVTARDESSGWHNRLFHAMPCFLSRRIGEFLYRHIA